MAQRATRSSTDELTAGQRQALASFSTLLAELGGAPQRVIIIDAAGRQVEVPPDALGELHTAVAAAARLLAAESGTPPLPDDRELTTTQAARWLQVSRQYLVDLLKAGAIPYQRVGTHHRIRVGDLRAFKTRQHAALREITRLGEELGYDA